MQRGDSRALVKAALMGKNKIQIHGMVETFGRYTNRVANVSDLRDVNRIGLPMATVEYTKDASFDARMAEIQSRITSVLRL